VGAMAALREAGVGVPADMSVAGFDDIATLRDTTPALTTVRLPLEDMGERAARLTLLPETQAGTDHTVTVPGEIILRDSTRPLA
jgi:LacI family transcriptional regulator